jgi:N-carbamoylputrescine amidase
MKVTVCELPDTPEEFEKAWPELIKHATENQSDLVLLNEMPAYPWFAYRPEVDLAVWQKAVEAHQNLLNTLEDFGQAAVLGTIPLEKDGKHLNQGFSWTREGGYRRAHEKYYFPDEEGFYEAHWFERGSEDFNLAQVREARCGFMICSEAMFNERARRYGREDAHLIAVPRATGGHARWEVGTRMAAIVSGAFVLSSNRSAGKSPISGVEFGGRGYVISPEGDILATTSRDNPFATVEIDLTVAEKAKATYPRDVAE